MAWQNQAKSYEMALNALSEYFKFNIPYALFNQLSYN